MLRAIAGRWVNDGHDVTVLTSQPSYNPALRDQKQPRVAEVDGFEVRRVGLFPETKTNFVARVLNLGLFMLRVFAHVTLRRRRYDVVMCATTPPVMVAWAAGLAAKLRGSRLIYHCQDIHPELLNLAGLMGPGLGYRFLRGRDIRTMNRASRVVVLSNDMRDTVERRGINDLSKVRIINNFTVPTFSDNVPVEVPESVTDASRFRVVFAGNLGYFQGLEAVIDAAKRLGDRADIEFVFLGDGAAKQDLIERAGSLVGKTVHFFGFRPQREAEEFVRHADLALITLSTDIYKAAYPSKTMTYLSVGTPLLAVVESDSELARLVVERQIGFVGVPSDAQSIAEAVLQADATQDRDSMRERVSATCDELFSESSRLELWSSLLAEPPSVQPLQPVFVIGAGRSGTKFLRNTLAAASDVAAVPYDIGYVWRRGNETMEHDAFLPDMLSPSARRFIRSTLPKLAEADASSRVLLEKSVPNTLRVAYLRAVYPNAKFIHLIRDGRAVTESSIRLWQQPSETGYLLQKLRYFPWANYRYAIWYIRNIFSSTRIWGPRYPGIAADLQAESLATVCARQWRVCVEEAANALQQLPPDQSIEVRFEDLVSDESVFESLCEFCGIDDTQAVLKQYRLTVNPASLDKWQRNLTDAQRQDVIAEIGAAQATLGYASDK